MRAAVRDHDPHHGHRCYRTVLSVRVFGWPTSRRMGRAWLRQCARAALTVLVLGTGLPALAALHATLGNGLRVVIVRNTLAPVVTTEMNYLVGSDEAPRGFPGTAHAQEHMMFRGSPGLSAAQLADITASMGGNFDADTQQSVTQYYFTVPSQDLDTALHVQALRMRGVLDQEKSWQQERRAIEQEVAQDLSNPQYVLYTKLLSAMFKGTPYAHDALGTRPSFDKTTGAMLKQFHQRWYSPSNAVLVVVGDIDPPHTLAQIKRLFGDIAPRAVPARPAFVLQPVKPVTLHMHTDQPYGTSVLAFRMPGFDSADFAAVQVLADVLSSKRGPLYGLVPQGKALNADFSIDMLPHAGLAYATASFPQGADGAALAARVRAVLQQILRRGVDADLVKAAKLGEIAGAEFQKNSISGLANAWSQALAVEGRASPDDDIAAIRKVTVADVNRVARRYLDFKHAIVAIATPQKSGQPVTSAGFGGKESFTPKRTSGVRLPPWARAAVQRLTLPTDSAQPSVSVLPNGIRLIVQHEDVSDTVSVFGKIRGRANLDTPSGKEGVSALLGQLLSYGTTTLDRIAYQRALDDISAAANAGRSFSLQVLSSHFDRGMQLLADAELHPALPAQALGVIRGQLAATVGGVLHSPAFQTRQALKRDLFPSHDPTLRHASVASVKSLTLHDVRDYYQRVFRPDLTTIVVVGNIDAKRARRVVEKYFGAWAANGPKPATDLPAVPANRVAYTAVPNPSRVQDQVVLAETLGLNRFSPDYYALELGNHVLGGAFYATRLYRDLREQAGLVYYVGSQFDIGKTRGVYFVSYACDPPNVSKARVIIEHDLHDMQTTPVSAAELHQAKAMLLREIPLSEASVGAIAGGLLERDLIGLPLDESMRAARRYLKLNAEQVRQAFARWLRLNDLVQVSQGPTPH